MNCVDTRKYVVPYAERIASSCEELGFAEAWSQPGADVTDREDRWWNVVEPKTQERIIMALYAFVGSIAHSDPPAGVVIARGEGNRSAILVRRSGFDNESMNHRP